jgi:hypothetical protein
VRFEPRAALPSRSCTAKSASDRMLVAAANILFLFGIVVSGGIEIAA